MIVPVEAELAAPPVFTEEEERTLRNEPTEVRRLPSHPGPAPLHAKPAKQIVNSSRSSQTDVEAAEQNEKFISVDFDKGENPRDWGKGKKWLVTISTSSLCLSVALGSALPTGE